MLPGCRNPFQQPRPYAPQDVTRRPFSLDSLSPDIAAALGVSRAADGAGSSSGSTSAAGAATAPAGGSGGWLGEGVRLVKVLPRSFSQVEHLEGGESDIDVSVEEQHVIPQCSKLPRPSAGKLPRAGGAGAGAGEGSSLPRALSPGGNCGSPELRHPPPHASSSSRPSVPAVAGFCLRADDAADGTRASAADGTCASAGVRASAADVACASIADGAGAHAGDGARAGTADGAGARADASNGACADASADVSVRASASADAADSASVGARAGHGEVGAAGASAGEDACASGAEGARAGAAATAESAGAARLFGVALPRAAPEATGPIAEGGRPPARLPDAEPDSAEESPPRAPAQGNVGGDDGLALACRTCCDDDGSAPASKAFSTPPASPRARERRRGVATPQSSRSPEATRAARPESELAAPAAFSSSAAADIAPARAGVREGGEPTLAFADGAGPFEDRAVSGLRHISCFVALDDDSASDVDGDDTHPAQILEDAATSAVAFLDQIASRDIERELADLAEHVVTQGSSDFSRWAEALGGLSNVAQGHASHLAGQLRPKLREAALIAAATLEEPS
eukprot:TRINITY_DN17836_c0_g1_i1.p1 TRINITY_DN17836_c0_g1~~TRINITY_DN17836_c0_g1_i1.p1  ORF type:complete len:603 (+),score=134.93 TRINITY_DN17836_c0_g1_i1:84-1811(+)